MKNDETYVWDLDNGLGRRSDGQMIYTQDPLMRPALLNNNQTN